GLLITSRAFLSSGFRPWATVRTVMSRSVTTPRGRFWASTTGISPQSWATMRWATSWRGVSGVQQAGLTVMASRTFMLTSSFEGSALNLFLLDRSDILCLITGYPQRGGTVRRRYGWLLVLLVPAVVVPVRACRGEAAPGQALGHDAAGALFESAWTVVRFGSPSAEPFEEQGLDIPLDRHGETWVEARKRALVRLR